MAAIVEIKDLRKTYDDGFEALKGVSLDIEEGEILALLGPNGAGKTTLISIICGIATATSGRVSVGGHDVVDEYREARKLIGLVPQEINIEPFESVQNTVRFTRGLFNLPRDDAHIEKILRSLTLWDKRANKNKELSGGMKRRVLIAKALSHSPRILFLDEPTAGVDVALRHDLWTLVEELRQDGVTIILTTHYIEEAEAIADRVGVINRGELLLVEEKDALMERMGKKELRVELVEPCAEIPPALADFDLRRADEGKTLIYTYRADGHRTGITSLLRTMQDEGLKLADLDTTQSTLEEIFVGLVKQEEAAE